MERSADTELRELLERLHDTYNRPEFIPDDPISVPHRFTDNVAQIIFTFHTVIQTGQEIVMCLILDFLLVLFLLCYINRRADYCRIAV